MNKINNKLNPKCLVMLILFVSTLSACTDSGIKGNVSPSGATQPATKTPGNQLSGPSNNSTTESAENATNCGFQFSNEMSLQEVAIVASDMHLNCNYTQEKILNLAQRTFMPREQVP